MNFLAAIPFRVYEYACLVLVIALGVFFYNAHERGIGEQHVREEIAKAQAEIQTKIDATASEANAKLQAHYTAATYVPFDYKTPANCGAVPDAVRVQVNAAHKAH